MPFYEHLDESHAISNYQAVMKDIVDREIILSCHELDDIKY